jgi:hypothetical protein
MSQAQAASPSDPPQIVLNDTYTSCPGEGRSQTVFGAQMAGTRRSTANSGC